MVQAIQSKDARFDVWRTGTLGFDTLAPVLDRAAEDFHQTVVAVELVVVVDADGLQDVERQ